MESNLEQIEDVEERLRAAAETKDTTTMSSIEMEVNDLESKVVQSEGLVATLESQMVEWNPLNKLIKRDEELDEVGLQIEEFLKSLNTEIQLLLASKGKLLQKVEDGLGPDEELLSLQLESFGGYQAELARIPEELIGLRSKREQCFERFSRDVPEEVKLERSSRHQAAQEMASERPLLPARDQKRESFGKACDIFYMISVNIKHKKAIEKLK